MTSSGSGARPCPPGVPVAGRRGSIKVPAVGSEGADQFRIDVELVEATVMGVVEPGEPRVDRRHRRVGGVDLVTEVAQQAGEDLVVGHRSHPKVLSGTNFGARELVSGRCLDQGMKNFVSVLVLGVIVTAVLVAEVVRSIIAASPYLLAFVLVFCLLRARVPRSVPGPGVPHRLARPMAPARPVATPPTGWVLMPAGMGPARAHLPVIDAEVIDERREPT